MAAADPASDAKDDLHRYLRRGTDALLAKTDGVSVYDGRRPMTPTGTSLFGMLKHVAAVQAEYLGAVFDRPFPGRMPAEGEDDMSLRADESVASVREVFLESCSWGDATIDALDLDSPGVVPWWPEERRHTNLSKVLVHLTTEVHRHAGHADILRESIDGLVGYLGPGSNMAALDADEWSAYREKLEAIARSAAD